MSNEPIEEIKVKGRATQAGFDMADAIIDFCHLMYQKDTATRVLQALADRLLSRIAEFKR